MLDDAATALLHAVLDEICESAPHFETGISVHVASKLLEATTRGELSRGGLKRVGRAALFDAPTMWR